jgi:hypothetical protein
MKANGLLNSLSALKSINLPCLKTYTENVVTIEKARTYALTLDDVVEQPHFEKSSFRINKKIFLTLDVARKRGCVKLSVIDQDVFSAMQKEVIYPVPNAWGKQGWTFIELQEIKMAVFRDIMGAAYHEVRNSVRAKRK